MRSVNEKDLLAAGTILGSSATTYYEVITNNSILSAVHVKWDAAIIVTISFELACFPDVAATSTTAGDWDPATDITPLVVPGGAAGGKVFQIGNNGAARVRMKLVVGGTGGVFRARHNGKG